jgi:arylsulfate sulfotransferase
MRLLWLVAPLACAPVLAAAEFTSPPKLVPNSNPEVPLAALVRFTASAPVTTTVTVSEGSRRWEVRFSPKSDPAAGLPLVGFYPGRTHRIEVAIRDAAGKTVRTAQSLEFAAPPLPAGAEDFPPIQVKTAGTSGMEPGWTLLSIRRQRRGGGGGGAGGAGGGGQRAAGAGAAGPPGEPVFTTGYGLILMLDEHGQVVWYYKSANRTSGVHRLGNGNIGFLTNDHRLVEVDLLGNVKGNWCAARRPNGPCAAGAIPVDALTMHHSFAEMPNGNFLVVSGEVREIDNYYTSETDPKAPRSRQKVMGDQVIEFDRTGRVVWRWSAFDHLDVYRLGFLTINQYWVIRGFPATRDWTHGNGVFHDERDNSVLFNSRQQSAVVKIERPSGRVAWIFGEPGGWPEKYQPLLFRREGVSEWPWHHHAPTLTPRGTLMVFNNGLYKTRPFHEPAPAPETVSGALEYSIDAKARRANLVWSSDAKGPDALNTFAMGDAAMLPKTGNVLVVYGSGVRLDDGRPWSRVREYTHTTPPRVLLDVVFAAPQPTAVVWIAFCGDRIAKLQ